MADVTLEAKLEAARDPDLERLRAEIAEREATIHRRTMRNLARLRVDMRRPVVFAHPALVTTTFAWALWSYMKGEHGDAQYAAELVWEWVGLADGR